MGKGIEQGETMIGSRDKDTARLSVRSLFALAAAGALAALLCAAPASAKTVYKYTYSGTFFDGADSDKGPFTARLSGLAYDHHRQKFLVSSGGSGGSTAWTTKFTLAGTADPFSGLAPGVDTVTHTGGESPFVAVDQSNEASDGNFYLAGNGFGFAGAEMSGFGPGGTLLPGWNGIFMESLCGVSVNSKGEVLSTARFGHSRFNAAGQFLDTREYLEPTLEKGEVLTFIENGTAVCRGVVDGNDDYYAISAAGRAKAFDGDTLTERYELSPFPGLALRLGVDPSNDDIFLLEGNSFSQFDVEGDMLGGGWGKPEGSYEGLEEAAGIAVDPVTHDVWVANRRSYAGARRVEKFVRGPAEIVPDTDADPVSNETTDSTKMTLHGTVNPDGIPTNDCHFIYGSTASNLNQSVPCEQGDVIAGSTDTQVSAEIEGLTEAKRYYFRLSASNGVSGRDSISEQEPFIGQGLPEIGTFFVDRVNTDNARLSSEITPNGGNTTYRYEYGTEPGVFTHSTTEPPNFGFFENTYQPETRFKQEIVTELKPGTEYFARVVAINEAGSSVGPELSFKTYVADPGVDPCANSIARQQSGSALLLDCRAYELVSAANAGGFDVASDLVPGLSPLPARPRASDSLLYSLHFGIVPGIAGSPTNLGLDPYVARRTANGWSTEYVGLPSDAMEDPGAFGSPLLGTDEALDAFAFGGTDICDPCFPDGSTNIPLRLPGGELIKGMAGSLNPPADPSQLVVKPLSGDGTHFVFGSAAKFDALGDAGGSLYDRDLVTGTTQVVSTTPGGTVFTGGNLAELDISHDGSRIVFGKEMTTDGKGNRYWDPYMHVGTEAASVELAPNASTGVLYGGMSSDGSRVFFASADKLIPADTDLSVDVYEAEIDESGTPSLRLISTKAGVPSNDDSCDPPGDPDDWNTISGEGRCGAVMFAGGAGVAADGTLYFVSPEQLDGAGGIQDQVNLYRVEPGGDPEFAETIDSSLGKPTSSAPKRPATNIVGGLSSPDPVAIDQATGDVYVFEGGEGGRIARYTSTGAPKDFPVPGGSNRVTGQSNFGSGFFGLAFDSAPGSPFNGSFYATRGAYPGFVDVFASSGEKLGAIEGFTFPCGVAVEPTTGAVYVSDPEAGTIWRFDPINAAGPVTEANYTKTGLKPGLEACQLAVDGAGHVYATGYSGGPLRVYETADFAAAPVSKPGMFVTETATAMATDPVTDDLYVDHGGSVTVYDSSLNVLDQFGGGVLSASKGIAVNGANQHVYATNGTSLVKFGYESTPYAPIDSPGVVNGVQRPGVHSYADFQVSPNGEFAVFTTSVPLTGHPSFGRFQIFRYGSGGEGIDCVSCAPTLSATNTDTFLTPTGLNLVDDGRVFFTTQESLALRDTNEKTDAYEWSDGRLQLISTGIGPDDSGLVSASADGRDAFFFTRDILVPGDENGNAVKIYTAREDGGFVHDPEAPPCAASDECHGPGTQRAAPPGIKTVTGSERSVALPNKPKKCKRGFVRKRGKCVKKKPRHRKASKRHGGRR